VCKSVFGCVCVLGGDSHCKSKRILRPDTDACIVGWLRSRKDISVAA
jgi:hypothetical protein